MRCSTRNSRSPSQAHLSIETTTTLAAEQPIMAVEFEAGFETLQRDSGIVAQVFEIHPELSEIRPEVDSFRREVWDGSAWTPLTDDPEVSVVGLNTFRVRWIFTLADDATLKMVLIEAEINPSWIGGSDRPPPNETDVANLAISIVSTYPIDSP